MKEGNNFAFIDSQNVYRGINALGWKLDWKRFRIYLAEKYHVKIAYMFIGYVGNNQKLYSILQEAGFILIFKPTVPDRDGKIKGNCDADMVLQTMIDYSKYEKAIIVTSDGDFYSLVNYLYEQGKLERVLSPYVKTCSALLRRSAKEKIIYMDNLRLKIGRPQNEKAPP